MLGLTVPSDGLEGDCGDREYPSRVQAVVIACGPTELVSMYNESSDEPGPVVDLLGGNPQELPDQYAKDPRVNKRSKYLLLCAFSATLGGWFERVPSQ